MKTLATATRPEAIWLGYPPLSGKSRVQVTLPADGLYTAWLGGDWYGRSSIAVDGRKVGAMREELNWPGNFTDLGTIPLTAGRHIVTAQDRPDLLGATYFGDALLYWRIADANAVVDPNELTDTLGTRVIIPLPPGM